MAAPVVATVGTLLAYASRTSSAFAVPASVASGDLIVVVFGNDTAALTITPPSGFVEMAITGTQLGTPSFLSTRIFWKRATAADSGTYTFTHGTGGTLGQALRITGHIATGTPLEALGGASSASSTTTPAVSGTTSAIDELLLFCAQINTSSTFTTPTGFTNVQSSPGWYVGSKTQATTDPTGSVTSTATGSGAEVSALIAIISTSPTRRVSIRSRNIAPLVRSANF